MQKIFFALSFFLTTTYAFAGDEAVSLNWATVLHKCYEDQNGQESRCDESVWPPKTENVKVELNDDNGLKTGEVTKEIVIADVVFKYVVNVIESNFTTPHKILYNVYIYSHKVGQGDSQSSHVSYERIKGENSGAMALQHDYLRTQQNDRIWHLRASLYIK